MRRLTRIASIGAVLCACSDPPPRVSLSNSDAPGPTSSSPAPLRIAITPMESPERTFAQYSELFEYVGRRLGRTVEVVQRQTYSEVVSLVQHRRVDAALVCSGPYVQAEEDFGAEVLAVPRIAGRDSYQAIVLVRRESPFLNFDDLRGRSFGLTDALSTSGMVYPACLVRERRRTTETYFSKVLFTKGHDNSIRAVADGLVDAASVSSLVFDEMAKQTPRLSERLRIVERSPPLGNPPIIVHPQLDPALKRLIRESLLGLREDPDAAPLLRRMGIERFVEGNPAAYAEVRRMRARVLPKAGR